MVVVTSPDLLPSAEFCGLCVSYVRGFTEIRQPYWLQKKCRLKDLFELHSAPNNDLKSDWVDLYLKTWRYTQKKRLSSCNFTSTSLDKPPQALTYTSSLTPDDCAFLDIPWIINNLECNWKKKKKIHRASNLLLQKTFLPTKINGFSILTVAVTRPLTGE